MKTVILIDFILTKSYKVFFYILKLFQALLFLMIKFYQFFLKTNINNKL